MLKPNNTRLCAGTAIAAALALAPTPLLAQQAAVPATVAPEPVLTVPEAVPTIPPPPPQQPTIVLPPELSVPTVEPAPVIDEPVAEPEPAGVPEPAAATEPVAEREPPAPASRAQAAVPAEAEAAEPEAAAPLDVEATGPVAVPVAEAEPLNAAAPADAGDNTHLWIAIVAGLVAVALAIWGFIAIGRRKPVERKAAAVVERHTIEPAERGPEPVAERTATVTPMPAVTARTAPAANLAHTGAAVALPSRLPQSFAERDALLKRMIAAKPDRANPFTAPKARLKRARLILQSLGRDFGDREPWIDLSQYPSNWPELARRRHAAA